MDERTYAERLATVRATTHEYGLPTAPEAERTIVRRTLIWCAVAPLASIVVGANSDEPVWLAAVLGGLAAVAFVVLARTWNPQWAGRWYAVAGLSLVSFHAAFVLPQWWVLNGFLTLIPLCIGFAVWSSAWRLERREVLHPERKMHTKITSSMERDIRKAVGE